MELEERNPKPVETSQNLPMAVLITLVGIVCLLLYVGWQMISDEPSKVSDISPTMVDPTPSEPATVVSDELETGESEEMPEIEMPKAETKTATPVAAPKVSTTSNGSSTIITHTVASGETFFGIANRYNVSTETLQSQNPDVNPKSIKVGATKLKVPVKAIHTVGAGDILRVVGGKYDVTVKLIMQANDKTKNYAKRGEKLVIPFAEKQ